MKPWHFSTDSLPQGERHRAWTKALHRLCLPAGEFPNNEKFCGSISCIVSPLGIEFARIDSAAHEISGAYPNQPSSIWLALLLEGTAEFSDDQQSHDMVAGDMAFGQSGMAAKLKFKSDCSQLFIKIPEIALSQRMIVPLSLDVGFLAGHAGINSVLSGMLCSLAADLGNVSESELRPIELALTELFITCLASAGKLSGGQTVGNHTHAVRTAHLHRLRQTIEACLGDSALNPKRIADEHGISLRYLQKLFSLSDQTFSGYVRSRRLERSRIDLASPLYAHLSITEICYRWGFNASAHFSRAFREHFRQSPSDYRRDPTGRDIADLVDPE